MAQITDYASLQTAVGDWLNRADLTAVIPTFIQLAETDFNHGDGKDKGGLRVREMQETTTLTVTNSGSISLPADFLELYDLEQTYPPSSTANPPLQYVGAEELKQIKSAQPSGVSRWYTIFGSSINIWPAADSGGFSVDLSYYQAIPALSVSATTNWLLLKSPNAYLYASLLQAAPYLKNDERIMVWGAGYAKAISSLQAESEGSMRPSTTLIARKRVF